jgi:hypothetical protein
VEASSSEEPSPALNAHIAKKADARALSYVRSDAWEHR